MELSESVLSGLRYLADPSAFDRTGFQVLVDVSFRSLLSSRGDPAVLGEPLPPLRRRLLSPSPLPVYLRADIQSSSSSSSNSSCRRCLDVYGISNPPLLLCCMLRVARNLILRVYVQVCNEARRSSSSEAKQRS